MAACESSCPAATRVICEVAGEGRAGGLFYNALITVTIQTMFSFQFTVRAAAPGTSGQEGQSQALLWQAQQLETTAVARDGPNVTTPPNQ